jgi:hypothetical protein
MRLVVGKLEAGSLDVSLMTWSSTRAVLIRL